VAHVELSVTEPQIPTAVPAQFTHTEPLRSLDRWAAAAAEADEACLVLNELLDFVAVSPTAARLLGFHDPADLLGRNLLAGLVRLVDFNQKPRPLPQGEIEKTPPVLAKETGRLARGLLRVESWMGVVTLDAVATPLFDGATVLGSLTFLADLSATAS
jgi:hypothetical protein